MKLTVIQEKINTPVTPAKAGVQLGCESNLKAYVTSGELPK